MKPEIKLYTLKNKHGLSASIINLGAIITSISTPDWEGNFQDITLGYDTLAEYLKPKDNFYYGAVVGRYGNRIAKGHFSLDGKSYQLAQNIGENHLHGGVQGLDQVFWEVEQTTEQGRDRLTLTYLAKDGEEGYPGNLQITITYTLCDDNTLTIDYHARTDQKTIVNLTNHSYYNLKGRGNGDILDHELTLNASYYVPIEDTMIPQGEITPVADSPFDFREGKRIGRDIQEDHPQLINGKGYDHYFIGDEEAGERLRFFGRLQEESTGRVMEVFTEESGAQIYTGNFLGASSEEELATYFCKHAGVCIETQIHPDSPNQANFPSPELSPEEAYSTKTIFKFSTLCGCRKWK